MQWRRFWSLSVEREREGGVCDVAVELRLLECRARLLWIINNE
jgi:hypothetical protein